MTYQTPQAMRAALEHRLNEHSKATDIGLDRLRRRVLFERIVARLGAAEPGRWVLKGGMALEVRLGDAARLTKDVDLGLRDPVGEVDILHDRLIEALAVDVDNDFFELVPALPVLLEADGGGYHTWRVRVAASLAGRPFGRIQLDISPRPHELEATEHVVLPNSLDFAGVPAATLEIINVNRHAAEKFHAMLRDYGDRENSRVRDLADIVILVEHESLTTQAVAGSLHNVWAERDGGPPPAALPPLPESWPDRYERLAEELELQNRTFLQAQDLVRHLWAEMFASKEP